MMQASALLAVLFGLLPAAADAAEVLPPEAPRMPREQVVPQNDDPFWPSQVLHGSMSSPERCAGIGGAVWATVEAGGECLRYYAHGLVDGSNPEVLVYIHGDFVVRNLKGQLWVLGHYGRRTPNSLQQEAKRWFATAGMPAIVLGRPGVYGSSGDHKAKATPTEVALIDSALERIKQRHGITRFHLTGQSGGGHSVAALLARRTDIGCAAISSGAVAIEQRYKELKRPQPADLYDPAADVDRIPHGPAPKIFVISDPEDKRVPFASQRFYVDRLKGAGLTPVHIIAKAKDKFHHALSDQARLAAALCAKGAAEDEIIRQVTALDSESGDGKADD